MFRYVRERIEESKKLEKELLADDELFDLRAQALRKSHRALTKVGFSDEDAVWLLGIRGPLVKVDN